MTKLQVLKVRVNHPRKPIHRAVSRLVYMGYIHFKHALRTALRATVVGRAVYTLWWVSSVIAVLGLPYMTSIVHYMAYLTVEVSRTLGHV